MSSGYFQEYNKKRLFCTYISYRMRLLTKSDQPPSRNSRRREYEAEQEFEQIQLNVKQEKTTVTSWHTLFLEKYRSLVIAGIGVAVFQQFQGANAIFTIFR